MKIFTGWKLFYLAGAIFLYSIINYTLGYLDQTLPPPLPNLQIGQYKDTNARKPLISSDSQWIDVEAEYKVQEGIFHLIYRPPITRRMKAPFAKEDAPAFEPGEWIILPNGKRIRLVAIISSYTDTMQRGRFIRYEGVESHLILPDGTELTGEEKEDFIGYYGLGSIQLRSDFNHPLLSYHIIFESDLEHADVYQIRFYNKETLNDISIQPYGRYYFDERYITCVLKVNLGTVPVHLGQDELFLSITYEEPHIIEVPARPTIVEHNGERIEILPGDPNNPSGTAVLQPGHPDYRESDRIVQIPTKTKPRINFLRYTVVDINGIEAHTSGGMSRLMNEEDSPQVFFNASNVHIKEEDISHLRFYFKRDEFFFVQRLPKSPIIRTENEGVRSLYDLKFENLQFNGEYEYFQFISRVISLSGLSSLTTNPWHSLTSGISFPLNIDDITFGDLLNKSFNPLGRNRIAIDEKRNLFTFVDVSSRRFLNNGEKSFASFILTNEKLMRIAFILTLVIIAVKLPLFIYSLIMKRRLKVLGYDHFQSDEIEYLILKLRFKVNSIPYMHDIGTIPNVDAFDPDSIIKFVRGKKLLNETN